MPTPSDAQYQPQNHQVQPPPGHHVNTLGPLPFTGADVGILTAAGVFLVATGFALKRLSNREPSQS